MGALPTSEYVESPDTPYVEELREFFDMHGLHFGRPEDIVPFAEKLMRAGTFRDDMRSMMRSVIFRERGSISRAGLLGIVTTAIGGPNVDDSSHDVAASVRTILAFLGEVTRAQWGMSGMEADESPEDLPERVPERVEVAPEVFSQQAPLSVESEAVAAEMETYASAYRYSYSRAMYPEPILQGGNLREFPMPLAPVPLAPEPIWRPVSPVVPRQEETVLFAWMKRPWVWLTGMCVVLAMGLMVVALGRSPESPGDGVPKATAPVVTPYSPSAPVSAAARAPHIATTATKPSAYGPPVRQGNSRVGRANTASVGTVSHNAYSDTPTAPVGSSDSVSAQPPAPIYRVSPTEDGSVAAESTSEPAVAQPARVTAASNSWRPPRATTSDWLAVPPGLMARNLISAPPPNYPRLASLVHVKGKVMLRAVVSRDGTVLRTEVLRGPHLLRGAAKDAVERWRFRPYVLNGRPTEVATVVTVDFNRKR